MKKFPIKELVKFTLNISQKTNHRKEWIRDNYITPEEQWEWNKDLNKIKIMKFLKKRINYWHWYYPLGRTKIKKIKPNNVKIWTQYSQKKCAL